MKPSHTLLAGFMWLGTIAGFQASLESWLRIGALLGSISASIVVVTFTIRRRNKITNLDVSLGN